MMSDTRQAGACELSAGTILESRLPGLCSRLYEAALEGDVPRARGLHALVMRIHGSLYHIGRHLSSIIKCIKCAPACLGVCDDFMAESVHTFRATERQRVERHLAELQPKLTRLVPGQGSE